MQGAASPLGGTLVASGTGLWVYEAENKGHYDFPNESSFRWHQDRYALVRRGIDEEAMLDCVEQVEKALGAPDWYKTFLGTADDIHGSPIPPAPPRAGYTANFGRSYGSLVLRSRKNEKILCVFTPCEFHSGGKDGIFEWYEEMPEEKRSAVDIIVDMNAKLDGRFSDVQSLVYTMGYQSAPSVEECRILKLPSAQKARLMECAYELHHCTRSPQQKVSLTSEIKHLVSLAETASAPVATPVGRDFRIAMSLESAEPVVHALLSQIASLVEGVGTYWVSKERIGLVFAVTDRHHVDLVCHSPNAVLSEESAKLAVRVEKKGNFYAADWEMGGITGTVYSQDKEDARAKATKAANLANGRIEKVTESGESTRLSTSANKDAITKRFFEKQIKDQEKGIKEIEAAKTGSDYSAHLPSAANEDWPKWKKEKLVSLNRMLEKMKADLASHLEQMSKTKSVDEAIGGTSAKPVGGLTRLWQTRDTYLNVRSSRIQRPKDAPYVYVSFPTDEAKDFFGRVPDHSKLVFELGDGFYKPTPHSRVTKDDYYFTLEKIDSAEQPTLKKKFRV